MILLEDVTIEENWVKKGNINLCVLLRTNNVNIHLFQNKKVNFLKHIDSMSLRPEFFNFHPLGMSLHLPKLQFSYLWSGMAKACSKFTWCWCINIESKSRMKEVCTEWYYQPCLLYGAVLKMVWQRISWSELKTTKYYAKISHYCILSRGGQGRGSGYILKVKIIIGLNCLGLSCRKSNTWYGFIASFLYPSASWGWTETLTAQGCKLWESPTSTQEQGGQVL